MLAAARMGDPVPLSCSLALVLGTCRTGQLADLLLSPAKNSVLHFSGLAFCGIRAANYLPVRLGLCQSWSSGSVRAWEKWHLPLAATVSC